MMGGTDFARRRRRWRRKLGKAYLDGSAQKFGLWGKKCLGLDLGSQEMKLLGRFCYGLFNISRVLDESETLKSMDWFFQFEKYMARWHL